MEFVQCNLALAIVVCNKFFNIRYLNNSFSTYLDYLTYLNNCITEEHLAICLENYGDLQLSR